MNFDIVESLKNSEFELFYQPILNLKDNSFLGVEALIRLIKNGEVLTPFYFLEEIKNNNLEVDLDLYVINKVSEDIEKILDKNNEVSIFINMSVKGLCDLGVIREIEDKLGKYNSNIVIEILEDELTNSLDLFIKNINLLKISGFEIALDDFGSGFSSFIRLKDIQFDYIKLDKDFISDLSDRVGKIISNIGDLAYNLNSIFIIEGIETEVQLKFLIDLGCLYGQGYYFCKPMKLSVLLEKISK